MVSQQRQKKVRIVLAQFDSRDLKSAEELWAHVDFLKRLMDKAVELYGKIDLFITPECSIQGVDMNHWENMLLEPGSPVLQSLMQKCSDLGVWGVFNPWLRSRQGRPYTNSILIIDQNGRLAHRYDKIHPWIPSETTNPGNEIALCRGPENIKIFCMLSSDGEYPSLWNHAKSSGADLIIRMCHYMTPCHGAYTLTNKAMALVSGCWTAACNATGIDDQYTYFGSSQVINPRGEIILEASNRFPGFLKMDLYPHVSHKEEDFRASAGPGSFHPLVNYNEGGRV